MNLTDYIRDVPDWPSPGVLFKDITPLLRDPDAFHAAVDGLAAAGRAADGEPVVDVVVGIEARGFILATPVAERLGVGFVPVRKAGKLPAATEQVAYDLEYGTATVEMHADALSRGERVLIVDDVLATGGTVVATAKLVRGFGAQISAVAVLLDLELADRHPEVDGLDVTVLLQRTGEQRSID